MLKLKAIKATLDQAGLNPRKHQRAIELARDIVATAALQDFQGATRSWKHKPSFKITRDSESTSIGTDSEIFGYVDQGTKPHIIRPKNKRLRFGAGFSPKTTPGSLSSGAGSRSGPNVYARVVHHPGTQARNFSNLVGEHAQELMEKTTTQQLAKAAANG